MILTTIARAVTTLTFGATNAAAGDTITIGSQTYTFRASTTTTAGEVKIGATVAATIQNIFDAVNIGSTYGTAGVEYGSLTVRNAMAEAVSLTATTLLLKARAPGAIGNKVTTTAAMTTSSACTFTSTVMGSGSGDVQLAISEITRYGQVNADVQQAFTQMGFLQ